MLHSNSQENYLISRTDT